MCLHIVVASHESGRIWGPEVQLSPCRQAPPAKEKVVNGDEDKPDVCTVVKALNQPKTEASQGEPLAPAAAVASV